MWINFHVWIIYNIMFPWEVFQFSLSSWLLHVNLIACNDGIFERVIRNRWLSKIYIPSKKHLLRHFCHCFPYLLKEGTDYQSEISRSRCITQRSHITKFCWWCTEPNDHLVLWIFISVSYGLNFLWALPDILWWGNISAVWMVWERHI